MRQEALGNNLTFEPTTPHLLTYKGQAIRSINKIIDQSVSEQDFAAIAYGLNLLIFAEVGYAGRCLSKKLADCQPQAAFQDFDAMTVHIRGLLQWANKFNGVDSIPMDVRIDVSL